MTDSTASTAFRFSKTTLDNGLDVIFRRQPQRPITAVNLWYHVGSKNEERNQRGFTHLVEHLMFEGSEHYPGDFFKHLQKLGAEINGSTSSDRTNYYVDLPAAHLERTIAMESDRMAHLMGALDENKLRVQKDVVTNEYRQNYANRPYGRASFLIAEALYPPQHPYNWLTIGVMEDIERASMEDVRSFYQRFYVPSNASLALVGDLEEDEAFGLAERYFGPIPGGNKAMVPRVAERPLVETIPIVLNDRVELDRLYLIWPTVRHFHDDDAALLIAGDILGRGRSSRLYRKLVLEEQIAQDVHAHQSGREVAGSFGIVVTLRPSRSIAEAMRSVLAELDRLAGSSVHEDELRRVQRQRVAAFWFALEHVGGFGGVADRLNAYNVYRGDPGQITSDVQRFERVTADEIQAAAGRYLAGRPRVELSVCRARQTSDVAPARPDGAAGEQSGPRLPAADPARQGARGWNSALGVSAQGPADAGRIDRHAGRSGRRRPDEAGLGQLTAAMLDEGTGTRSAEQIALRRRVDGGDDRRLVRLGGCVCLVQVLEGGLPREPRPGG